MGQTRSVVGEGMQTINNKTGLSDLNHTIRIDLKDVSRSIQVKPPKFDKLGVYKKKPYAVLSVSEALRRIRFQGIMQMAEELINKQHTMQKKCIYHTTNLQNIADDNIRPIIDLKKFRDTSREKKKMNNMIIGVL